MATTFSHFGICVSDLERSLRFYCEALGFASAESHTVGEEFGPLMELDGWLCVPNSSAATASPSSCCSSPPRHRSATRSGAR